MCELDGQGDGIHLHAHKFRHTFPSREPSPPGGSEHPPAGAELRHTTLTMVSRYVYYSPTDLLDAWQLRRV
jgi:hypothetical protein